MTDRTWAFIARTLVEQMHGQMDVAYEAGEACHPDADLVYFFIKQTKNKATTTTPMPMMIHLFAVVTSF